MYSLHGFKTIFMLTLWGTSLPIYKQLNGMATKWCECTWKMWKSYYSRSENDSTLKVSVHDSTTADGLL